MLAPAFHDAAGLFQFRQQGIQVGGLLFQRPIDGKAQRFPVRGLGGIAQPLVVALAVGLGVLHDGVAVLNADGIAQPPHRPGAAQKIAELAVAVQVDRIPNDVVMDVRLVDVGTDDKVISPGTKDCRR